MLVVRIHARSCYFCSFQKYFIKPMYTLNCRGKLLSLANPVVMGIMNATPDSFHTGQLQFSEREWIDLASQMIQDGASLIDIGGQSTRSGSIRLSAEDEMARV